MCYSSYWTEPESTEASARGARGCAGGSLRATSHLAGYRGQLAEAGAVVDKLLPFWHVRTGQLSSALCRAFRWATCSKPLTCHVPPPIGRPSLCSETGLSLPEGVCMSGATWGRELHAPYAPPSLKPMRPTRIPTVLLVVCSLVDWSAAHSCDDTCQSEQHAALHTLYSSLNGPAWRNSSGWNQPFAKSSSGQPVHCNAYGVHCCSEQGYTTIDIPFGPAIQLACTDPGSVLVLYMISNNLKGTLPEAASVWSPFDDVLYMALSGEALLASSTVTKAIALHG